MQSGSADFCASRNADGLLAPEAQSDHQIRRALNEHLAAALAQLTTGH